MPTTYTGVVKYITWSGGPAGDYVCKGSADQTIINQAFTWAKSNPGTTVYLRGPHTYSISGQILLCNNVKFTGDSTAVLKVANYTAGNFPDGTPVICTIGKAVPYSIEICGFEIDGNCHNQSQGLGTTKDGRGKKSSPGSGVERLTWFFGQSGKPGTDISMHDMYTHDAFGESFIASFCQGLQYYNNKAINHQHDTVFFKACNGSGNAIHNNYIEGITSDCIRTDNSSNIDIYNNTLLPYTGPYTTGTTLKGENGVQIDNASSSSYANYHENNINFYNNIVTGHLAGIWINDQQSSGTRVQTINIHHNKFSDNGWRTDLTRSCAIAVDWGNGITIEKNTFENNGRAAIGIYTHEASGTTISIKNNNITGTTTKGGYGYGIWNAVPTYMSVVAENNYMANNSMGNYKNVSPKSTASAAISDAYPSGSVMPGGDTGGNDNNDTIGILECTAIQMSTTLENSTTQLQWNYAENLNDGRGITFGCIGFCTGTYDGNILIKYYSELNPSNTLAKYIPALNTIDAGAHTSADGDGNPSVVGLDNFIADVKNCTDISFKKAQFYELEQMYYNPALNMYTNIGAKYPLTLALIYDMCIRHGSDETQALITSAGTTPASGADEKTFLAKLISLRDTKLKSENLGDVNRDAGYAALLNAGNLYLSVPFTFVAYGDSFTIDGNIGVDGVINTGNEDNGGDNGSSGSDDGDIPGDVSPVKVYQNDDHYIEGRSGYINGKPFKWYEKKIEVDNSIAQDKCPGVIGWALTDFGLAGAELTLECFAETLQEMFNAVSAFNQPGKITIELGGVFDDWEAVGVKGNYTADLKLTDCLPGSYHPYELLLLMDLPYYQSVIQHFRSRYITESCQFTSDNCYKGNLVENSKFDTWTPSKDVKWISQNSIADNEWRTARYSPETQKLCAVAASGDSNRIMVCSTNVVKDLSGNGNDGTFLGTASIIDSGGIQYINGYFYVENSVFVPGTANFSFSFKFQTEGLGLQELLCTNDYENDNVEFSPGMGFYIPAESPYGVFWAVDSDYKYYSVSDSETDLRDGRVHTVTCARRGNTLTMTVDTKEYTAAYDSIGSLNPVVDGYAYIGGCPDSPDENQFTGILHDFTYGSTLHWTPDSSMSSNWRIPDRWVVPPGNKSQLCKFLDGTSLNEIYGTGWGRYAATKGDNNDIVASTVPTLQMGYSYDFGVPAKRIGFYAALAPFDNGRTNINVMRIKTVLHYNHNITDLSGAGSIATGTRDGVTGVYLEDPAGNNATTVELTASQLSGLGYLTVDSSNHTITEEFQFHNTNTGVTSTDAVLADGSSTTGWAASSGSVSTLESLSGAIHVKGNSNTTALLIKKSFTSSTFTAGQPYFCFDMKYAGTYAPTGLYFRLTDSAGKQKTWSGSRFPLSTNYQTFVLPFYASASSEGQCPTADTGLDVTKIIAVEIGVAGTSKPFEYYVDNLKISFGVGVWIEIQVPDELEKDSLDFYTYDGTQYQLCENYELNDAYVPTNYQNSWRGEIWCPEWHMWMVSSISGLSKYAVMVSPDGESWYAKATPATADGIAWGYGLWIPPNDTLPNGRAIFFGYSGTGNRVLYTDDKGVTWTQVAAASNTANWLGAAYAPTLHRIVAISYGGATGQQAMYSDNFGATWTLSTTPTPNRGWTAITWADDLNLFAAVADSGTQQVMTSPTGLSGTWTLRDTPIMSSTKTTGTGDVSTNYYRNPDGVVYSSKSTAYSTDSSSLVYSLTIPAPTTTGNNLRIDQVSGYLRTCICTNSTAYCKVTISSTSLGEVQVAEWSTNSIKYVQESKDLATLAAVNEAVTINYYLKTNLASHRAYGSILGCNVTETSTGGTIVYNRNQWRAIIWSDTKILVAVAQTGALNGCMHSTDAITWTADTTASDNGWDSLCYDTWLGRYVAVANTGTGNRVMACDSFDKISGPDSWTVESVGGYRYEIDSGDYVYEIIGDGSTVNRGSITQAMVFSAGMRYVLSASVRIAGLTAGKLIIEIVSSGSTVKSLSWDANTKDWVQDKISFSFDTPQAGTYLRIRGYNLNFGAHLYVAQVLIEKASDFEIATLGSDIKTFGTEDVIPDVLLTGVSLAPGTSSVASTPVTGEADTTVWYSSAATAYANDGTSLEYTFTLDALTDGSTYQIDQVYADLKIQNAGVGKATAYMLVTITGSTLNSGAESELIEWTENANTFVTKTKDLNIQCATNTTVTIKVYMKTSNATYRSYARNIGYKAEKLSTSASAPVSNAIKMYNADDVTKVLLCCNKLLPKYTMEINADGTGSLSYSDNFGDMSYADICYECSKLEYHEDTHSLEIDSGQYIIYEFDCMYPVCGTPYTTLNVISGAPQFFIADDSGTNGAPGTFYAIDTNLTSDLSDITLIRHLISNYHSLQLTSKTKFYVKITSMGTESCQFNDLLIYALLSTVDAEHFEIYATGKANTIGATVTGTSSVIATLRYHDYIPAV